MALLFGNAINWDDTFDPHVMETSENDNTSKDESIVTPSHNIAPLEPAQSKVLRNRDILESVFSFFSNSSNAQPGGRIQFPDSQHLLWASLTSKDLFDPAMDVLWRSMDSLLPFLRLIPLLVIEGRNITSTGVILEEHIENLARYTRRVRHLHVAPLGRTVSPHIPFSIGEIMADSLTTLAPGLRTLDISRIADLSNDDLAIVFLFISSTLSEVILGGIAPNTEVFVSTFLHRIVTRNRPITKLKLGGQLTSLSLDLMNRFTKLETLSLDIKGKPLSKGTMQKLSQIPFLKELYLLLDNNCTFLFPSSPTVSKFLRLQTLEITGSAHITMMILLFIETPLLNSIAVNFTSLGQDVGAPGKCLQRMTDIAPCLESIQITSSDANVCIPEVDLKSLGSFPNLERVEMTVDYLNTQTFLGQDWPSIKYLQLISKGLNPQANTISGISFERSQFGLSHLPEVLQACPRLKTLLISISLDMSPSAIWSMQSRTGSDRGASYNRLDKLVLLPFMDPFTAVLDNNSAATISNAFTVSRFVDKIIPNLRKFDLSKLTDVNKDWREGVQTMVKELPQIRKQKNSKL